MLGIASAENDVVRLERRDDLRSERPGEERTEQRGRRVGEPARRDAAEQRADGCEGEVDEAAVCVVPGAGRLDRPGNRRRLPEHKGPERCKEDERRARQCRRPQRPADRSNEHGSRPDPEQPGLARAGAEEEGCEAESGCGARGKRSPNGRCSHGARG